MARWHPAIISLPFFIRSGKIGGPESVVQTLAGPDHNARLRCIMAESILSAPALILSTVREIPLTQGKVALVDAADYEWLSQRKWRARVFNNGSLWYAVTNARGQARNHRHLSMHRAILKPPKSLHVDHINHNGLDNRRDNLRLVTNAQNCWNQRPASRGASSQFKGVVWHKGVGKWQAEIRVSGKRLYLGCFSSEIEAARAYDAAALQNFGGFAFLNADAFPDIMAKWEKKDG